MKKTKFQFSCEWVARNDSAADGADYETISAYVTTALVADTFGKSLDETTRAIYKIRAIESPNRLK